MWKWPDQSTTMPKFSQPELLGYKPDYVSIVLRLLSLLFHTEVFGPHSFETNTMRFTYIYIYADDKRIMYSSSPSFHLPVRSPVHFPHARLL